MGKRRQTKLLRSARRELQRQPGNDPHLLYPRQRTPITADSLAAYSLFDREESKRILDEIEEAYSVLSDSEKRRRYDESHGIVSSEAIYDAYHRGNHAVAAFSRDGMQNSSLDHFSFEEDPFRKPVERPAPAATAPAKSPHASSRQKSRKPPSNRPPAQKPPDRIWAKQPWPPAITRSCAPSRRIPTWDERIAKCENVNGAFLRSVREYKKVSADEIMNVLKISKTYLTAIEEDDVDPPARQCVRARLRDPIRQSPPPRPRESGRRLYGLPARQAPQLNRPQVNLAARKVDPCDAATDRRPTSSDVFLTLALSHELSRTRAQKLIAEGWVTVNGEKIRGGLKLEPGAEIAVFSSRAQAPAPLAPEEIPLRVHLPGRRISP